MGWTSVYLPTNPTGIFEWAHHLPQSSWQGLIQCSLTPVIQLFPYIADVLLLELTVEFVVTVLVTLTVHMKDNGWAINPQKVQGSRKDVTFLDILWHTGQGIIPKNVKWKILETCIPTNNQETQRFVELLGYWHCLNLHLAVIPRLQYAVTQRKIF